MSSCLQIKKQSKTPEIPEIPEVDIQTQTIKNPEIPEIQRLGGYRKVGGRGGRGEDAHRLQISGSS